MLTMPSYACSMAAKLNHLVQPQLHSFIPQLASQTTSDYLQPDAQSATPFYPLVHTTYLVVFAVNAFAHLRANDACLEAFTILLQAV